MARFSIRPIKRIIEKYLLNPFGFGFCYACGKITRNQNWFADDAEQDEEGVWRYTGAYKDYIHTACYEKGQEMAGV